MFGKHQVPNRSCKDVAIGLVVLHWFLPEKIWGETHAVYGYRKRDCKQTQCTVGKGHCFPRGCKYRSAIARWLVEPISETVDQSLWSSLHFSQWFWVTFGSTKLNDWAKHRMHFSCPAGDTGLFAIQLHQAHTTPVKVCDSSMTLILQWAGKLLGWVAGLHPLPKLCFVQQSTSLLLCYGFCWSSSLSWPCNWNWMQCTRNDLGLCKLLALTSAQRPQLSGSVQCP